MCLDMRYDRKTEKAMIAKLPDEFVVYKVVRLYEGKYYSRFGRGNKTYPCKFRKGVNVSRSKVVVSCGRNNNYTVAYHSFKTKQRAINFNNEYWHNSKSRIIKARVRKEDITVLGKQNGCEVIVSKKIIMPSPSDERVVVR